MLINPALDTRTDKTILYRKFGSANNDKLDECHEHKILGAFQVCILQIRCSVVRMITNAT